MVSEKMVMNKEEIERWRREILQMPEVKARIKEYEERVKAKEKARKKEPPCCSPHQVQCSFRD